MKYYLFRSSSEERSPSRDASKERAKAKPSPQPPVQSKPKDKKHRESSSERSIFKHKIYSYFN